jgi:hypothetical protein
MAAVRKRWGFCVLALVCLVALIKLLKQPLPGHFRVFAGAGHAVWTGGNPYGTDFGTGVGYFFYSPACAMTVFGPISALPEKLGIIVYMVGSVATFVGGAIAFWRAFKPRTLPPEAIAHWDARLQWFFVAASPQLFGGILASKLEVLITGMILLAVGWLRRTASSHDGRTVAACALLAMTLNWKFQPLPLVGLACLSWILILRDGRVPAMIAAFVALLYALPYTVLSSAYLHWIQETWRETFTKFVVEAFLGFENVFAFLHALGIDLTFKASQSLSAIVGFGFAAFVCAWIPRSWNLRNALLLSTALGAAFMTAFSPLGQNNAMTLYTPLLLVGFACLAGAGSGSGAGVGAAEARKWKWILAGVFAWMTLLYSDAVPVDMRNQLRHYSLKPLACLFLAAAIAREAWRGRGTFADR